MRLTASNLLKHGYLLLVTHNFSTSPLINVCNYLSEINCKTSHNRTNPKGHCIFLSTAEITNMAFKFALTAHIMLMKKPKKISTSSQKHKHTTQTPEKSKVFSLGTKKAISGVLSEWYHTHNILIHTYTHERKVLGILLIVNLEQFLVLHLEREFLNFKGIHLLKYHTKYLFFNDVISQSTTWVN